MKLLFVKKTPLFESVLWHKSFSQKKNFPENLFITFLRFFFNITNIFEHRARHLYCISQLFVVKSWIENCHAKSSYMMCTKVINEWFTQHCIAFGGMIPLSIRSGLKLKVSAIFCSVYYHFTLILVITQFGYQIL